MSRAACELVRITTGTRFTDGCFLTSFRTSNPSFLGMFKSSRIRSGLGAFSKPGARFRKARANSPSVATLMRFSTFPYWKASWTNSTSPGLSSINRISAGLFCTFTSISVSLEFGDGEAEGGSRPWLRFHPELSPQPLYDFPADREPNPGARVLVPGMQTLKHPEDAFGMLRFDPDAVILDRNRPLAVAVHRGNVDSRAFFHFPELDGVGEQVLEHLGELPLVRPKRRQWTRVDGSTALLDRNLRIPQGCRNYRAAVDLAEVKLLAFHAGIRQQVGDQLLHALGAVHGVVNVPVGSLIQAARVAVGKQLGRSEEHTSELLSRQYLVCR